MDVQVQQQSDDVNILEDQNLYIHQYIEAIFHIDLDTNSDDPNYVVDNDEHSRNKKDKHQTIFCVKISPDSGEQHLSFTNFSRYVFSNLMEQNLKTEKRFIDKRFIPAKKNFVDLFDDKFCVSEIDYSNLLAYLFDCYCRSLWIVDFANIIPNDEKKKITRYIVDQAALLLVMPYMNIRYSESSNDEPNDSTSSTTPSNTSNNNNNNNNNGNKKVEEKPTPIDDLYEVITNRQWRLNYFDYVKKYFLDITEAIHNAKNKIEQQGSDYVSLLSDVSEEELTLEPIITALYEKLRQKFKNNHKLTAVFVSDIEYVSLLYSSAPVAEIFIGLNYSKDLRDYEKSVESSDNKQQQQQSNNSSGSDPNDNSDNYRESFRNIFLAPFSMRTNPDGSSSVSSSPTIASESEIQQSLLGLLLSCSSLPSPFSQRKTRGNNPINILFNNVDYEYDFFENPTVKTKTELANMEMEIDNLLRELRGKIKDIIYGLLKYPASKKKILKWLEHCLATFNGRSKLWANEIFSLVSGNTSHTSDGFMLNLSAVLLLLAKPFCSPNDSKPMFQLFDDYSINLLMLKVDPLYIKYCQRGKAFNDDYPGYLRIFRQESTLTGFSKIDRAISDKYEPNFITRSFFMAHKCLHLGFRILHERYTAINQENSQLQRRIEQLGPLALTNPNPQQQETINRYNNNLTITLSMKALLTEEEFLNILLDFFAATACWINNLAVTNSEQEAAKEFKKIEMDLNNQTDYFKVKSTKNLRLIPEFMIENVIDFWLFLRYFEIRPKIFRLKNGLEPFLVMVVLFMGTPVRMRNPHLRAKLAEMFESLLPGVQTNFPTEYLEPLPLKPYFAEEIFPALLNGFISIEISDDANNFNDVVQFEQKFNYRRPMYVVFKHLCTIEQHQLRLISLASYAEKNLENVRTPIFLRFINLLINDAIFLLDESLSLISRLRELEQERDSPSWASLPVLTRQQNEANFTHLGRLAKFHNFIGRETIITISTITAYVKSFFSQSILAERMAAMLNYFLLNLVGPKQKNFKVKQSTDFEFNPGYLVVQICRVYVNLACNNPISSDQTLTHCKHVSPVNPKWEEFCVAIGRDDRSYSPDLLVDAERLLSTKLGKPMLGQDILTIDKSVKELMKKNENSEIPLEEIPEDFLDPLMSTLMQDPVILPHSRKTLDRSTITRHLLSDHTDPYTRTPLKLHMLEPDVELKKKITEFVEMKIKERQLKAQLKMNQEAAERIAAEDRKKLEEKQSEQQVQTEQQEPQPMEVQQQKEDISEE